MYGQGATNENWQDAETWLKAKHCKPQELYFDYCIEVGNFEFVYDKRNLEFLRRFSFLEDYKIPSFSSVYDELPAVWVDAVEIIKTNMNEAIKVKNGNQKA